MRWFGTVFGVRGDWGVARYERIGSNEEKDIPDSPMKTTGKAKTKTNNSGGRSTPQWMAARLFSSLGAVFYWTIPGINLNAGQSKLPILLFP
jgi:hypothetical protein